MDNELLQRHKKISLTIRLAAYIFSGLNKIGEIDIDKFRSEFKGRVNLREVDVIYNLIDYAVDLIKEINISEKSVVSIVGDNATFPISDILTIIKGDLFITHHFARVNSGIAQDAVRRLNEYDTPFNEKITINYREGKLKIFVE